MAKTLAFDVYGTLIDTQGVVELLRSMIGDQAVNFSQSWRDKQLEYSFRRGLMGVYDSFAVCTRQALDFTDASLGTRLSDQDRDKLMARYLELPVFDDVKESLQQLQSLGHQLVAFSNGTAEAVDTLLVNADIRDCFVDIVSVDELKTFKPDPRIYQHLVTRCESSADQTWLISSNPFDVIGAITAGLSAAWVKRSEQSVFDPWGIEPTVTIGKLTELGGCLD